MIVQLYGQLRLEAGSRFVEVRLGGKRPLREALKLLPTHLRRHILDENDEIRPGLLILVNDTDARTIHRYELDVSDDDRIVIVPMIHGGAD